MIELAKYIGMTLIAIVFLAIPALLVLSIILDWGVLLNILLVGLVLCQIISIIFVIKLLDEDGVL